jgi:SAM-dependent methyltransferase
VTGNRWLASGAPRGHRYDQRFDDLAAAGHDMHGEATLVEGYGPGRVLDAGCGTGRVAIELDRRGHQVVGVDLDPEMLAVARAKAPHLTWVEADLADPTLDLGQSFDTVVLAGNVLIFVTPGTEGAVIAGLARHLRPGGRLIAGYSLEPGRFGLDQHDAFAAASGLALEDRWSTWDRQPSSGSNAYAVSVHRRLD